MTFSLLFLPALLFFTAPAAQAAGSTQCAQVQDLEAVSTHYVQRVIQRADDGMAYARSAEISSDFDRYMPGWAKTIGSTWAGLLDSQIQRTFESQDLPHVTACQHFDTLLIDCKIEEVRQELHAQMERGSIGAISRLLDLLKFLNERRRYLHIGALDPTFNDPTWGNVYSFDDPEQVWCCPESIPGNTCAAQAASTCSAGGGMPFTTLSQCVTWGCQQPEGVPVNDLPTSGKADVMCPFDADYGPAFENGFGCDLETMQSRSAYAPLQAELEALSIIKQQVDEFRRTASGFLAVQRDIDELFGNASTTPEPPRAREHKNAFGCGWTAGYCKKNDDKRCYSDSDCGEGEGECDVPEKICEGNYALRCTKDQQCGNSGPCIEEKVCTQNREIRCADDEACVVDDRNQGPCVREDVLPDLRELRGPFSLDKDQIAILSDFLGERSMADLSREFSDDLKLPQEFSKDQTEERELREWQQKNPFTKYFRESVRTAVSIWSRIQSRKEVGSYPESVDAQLEIAKSLSSLRKAVSGLAKIASEKKEGLRAFVIRYAYFLRRTCIHRSCSLLLDQVIRIATTDDCFPYANGQFLSDTEDDPRWQKCKKEAGIE